MTITMSQTLNGKKSCFFFYIFDKGVAVIMSIVKAQWQI